MKKEESASRKRKKPITTKVTVTIIEGLPRQESAVAMQLESLASSKEMSCKSSFALPPT